MFSGPSGIGKTNMALALLREGYSFLSDDIIVLHRADRVSIEPYTRPLGIREDTLDRFPNILAGLGNVPRFATPTGRTAVPHVNLLPLKKREEPATWTWTVTLERAEARGVRELGPRTLAVTMRTVDADLEWAAKLATDWMQHDRPAK